MESNGTNWIKAYIVDIMPCVTVAIYVLSFIYNVAYYSVFNINIINHITIQDTFISIIETIIVFSMIVLILIASFVIGSSMMNRIGDKGTIRRFNYRILRKYVYLRKYKLIRWYFDYNKKQRRLRYKRNKSKQYSKIIQVITFLFECFIIILISSILFDAIKYRTDFMTGLYGPVVGLIIPLLIAPFVDTLLFMSMRKYKRLSDRIEELKSTNAIVMLIVYYFYAIILFFTCGIDNGKYFKDNSKVAFEVKASDGTIFDDSNFFYVGQLNDKVFLMDKKTSSKIILNNEGITYMVINDKDGQMGSVIVNFFNSSKKIDNIQWKQNK